MEIKIINKDLAIAFINKNHYSQILPRLTKYYLGVYDEDVFCGVITLGYGTQPLGTIRKIFYKDELITTDYLEIGKMCFSKNVNGDKSFGSRCISCLVKWLKTNLKTVMFLYTMADGIMGKAGYVYQASSFIYLGSFWTSVYMDNETKEKIHPRSAKKLCIENALFENKQKVFWLTQSFCEKKNISKIDGLMFRYILPLNKNAKKIIEKYEEYKNVPYPKEKDLLFKKRVGEKKFVFIEKPTFNMRVFFYNYQKPNEKHYQLDLFEDKENEYIQLSLF